MTRLRLAALALLVAACRGPTDDERRGDAAYAAGRTGEALAAYRVALRADTSGRLLAKVAASALRAGERLEAAAAYGRLAAEDPSRADEAADGLELVAHAAEREGDPDALRAALLALAEVAPRRPEGRVVLAAIREGALGGADVARFLPAAVAAAPDPATADSLLLALGRALQRSEGCRTAVGVYDAIRLRSDAVRVRQAAEAATGSCALELGRAALDSLSAGGAILAPAVGATDSSAAAPRTGQP